AKDTLRNVRETKEFVVNVVTHELAEAMNLTSGEYDASVNEFELAKLTRIHRASCVRPESRSLRSALSAGFIKFSIFLLDLPAAAS
ncbi:MAG: hypothetical protein WBV98_26425, partial [Candidatus Sulfotelmatobacter sp.]